MNESPKSDFEVVRTEDHVEFMKRTHLWPFGGAVLMLKRYRGKVEELA